MSDNDDQSHDNSDSENSQDSRDSNVSTDVSVNTQNERLVAKVKALESQLKKQNKKKKDADSCQGI